MGFKIQSNAKEANRPDRLGNKNLLEEFDVI